MECDKKIYINYVRLHSRIPWRSKFLYLDSTEFLADDVFIKHKLRVRFKGEYSNPNTPILIVTCSIPKRKEDIFMGCMKELYNKFLILNKSEAYVLMCEWLNKNFNKK